jgi:saxitoxin biosynthesis operon SxtJ-like protein
MTTGAHKPPAVHEDFSREVEFKNSSNRAFGFAGAAALGLLGLWPLVRHRPLRPWALALAVVLLVPALLKPQLLGPANRLWLRFGVLMQRLVTPVVMTLVFYSTLTPVALVLRLLGRDLLRLQIDRTASTYWVERRPPGPAPDTMRQQF